MFPLSGGMWLLVIWLWFYNSSELVSYLEGMTIVVRASSTGCAGLGILLVYPILTSVFFLSILFAFDGMLRGRAISQAHWIRLVSWFGYGVAHSQRLRS